MQDGLFKQVFLSKTQNNKPMNECSLYIGGSKNYI